MKNSKSLTAKAVRTLKTDYRLALSGTPIENHLGELPSLFGFLNPGLLEASSWKAVLQKGVQADDPLLQLLKKALRPYNMTSGSRWVGTQIRPTRNLKEAGGKMPNGGTRTSYEADGVE